MQILIYILAALGALHLLVDLAVWFVLWRWSKEIDEDEEKAEAMEEEKRRHAFVSPPVSAHQAAKNNQEAYGHYVRNEKARLP